ncbi:hypothetical protein [Streptomyces sp. NPDC055013]
MDVWHEEAIRLASVLLTPAGLSLPGIARVLVCIGPDNDVGTLDTAAGQTLPYGPKGRAVVLAAVDTYLADSSLNWTFGRATTCCPRSSREGLEKALKKLEGKTGDKLMKAVKNEFGIQTLGIYDSAGGRHRRRIRPASTSAPSEERGAGCVTTVAAEHSHGVTVRQRPYQLSTHHN